MTTEPDGDEIVADFHRDGVVHVRDCLSCAWVEEIVTELDRYERYVLPGIPRADFTLEPDGRTVRNLWRMDHHDDFFRALRQREDFVSLAGCFLASPPASMSVETFAKPPRVGSAVPYHQDNAYFCLEPADVLTLWVPLDEVTEENGAVEYLLRSHRELLPHAPSGVTGNSYGLAQPPAKGAFETWRGIVSPGDVVVHHGEIIHRSPANLSGSARRSLVIVYRGQKTRVDAARLASLPRRGRAGSSRRLAAGVTNRAAFPTPAATIDALQSYSTSRRSSCARVLSSFFWRFSSSPCPRRSRRRSRCSSSTVKTITALGRRRPR
jgi:hypothetical protein